MTGIRVISSVPIDWLRVSRLAKSLGMFAAIAQAGCATATEEGRAKNSRVGVPQPVDQYAMRKASQVITV